MAGLNDAHQGQISRYFSFFKGKKQRCLADRDDEAEEFKQIRLGDDGQIHTNAEALMLIDAYNAQVRQQYSEELDKIMGLSAVYISTILSQAEQSGLTLESDICLSEDQSKIDSVGALQAAGAPPLMPQRPGVLPSLGAGGAAGDPGVLAELEELRAEKRQLSDRFQLMQSEVSELLRERSSLSSELDKVKTNFMNLRVQMQETTQDAATNASVAQIEYDLNNTKEQLDAKSAEAEQMRGELNQRVGDTQQFRDMKSIMKQKSDQVRRLRQTLVAHGIPMPDEEGGGMELTADD